MKHGIRNTPKGAQHCDSYYTNEKGEEIDIRVSYYVQAAEPDTGTDAGYELDSLTSLDGKDLWDEVSEERKDEMCIEIGERDSSYYDDGGW